MTAQHPVVERYLARFTESLADLSPTDRTEVVEEIRSHLAEAVAAGRPLDAALSALGSAEDLARAYQVEVLVNPRHATRQVSGLDRLLRIAALVIVGSIPTIAIVATLGAIGGSFILAGFAVFVAGVLGVSGSLPPWVSMDVHPAVAVLLGPCMVVTGIVAVAGLVFYIKFLARAVRAVLPKRG